MCTLGEQVKIGGNITRPRCSNSAAAKSVTSHSPARDQLTSIAYMPCIDSSSAGLRFQQGAEMTISDMTDRQSRFVTACGRTIRAWATFELTLFLLFEGFF